MTVEHIPAAEFEPCAPAERTEALSTRRSPGFWREVCGSVGKSGSALVFVALLALIVMGAIFLPFFCQFDYAAQNVAFANRPFFSPDPESGLIHIFGTDYLGRDLFARIWYGARVSLFVAGAAALIDCVVGAVYGGISGYLGGTADLMMMRVLEIIGGIPYLIVVLLLMAVLPRGVGTLILAYSLVGWTGMARLVRGQVVSLKRQEFMVAARIMGAGAPRIILRHLLPNVVGVAVVHMTLDIPGVIFTEAFLSMLGMGVPPPFPSWGVMASEGVASFQTYPAQLAVPATMICLTMLAFNLLGDRMQDAFDPKLRRRGGSGKRTQHRKPARNV